LLLSATFRQIVLSADSPTPPAPTSPRQRARACGVRIGVLPPGERNAITDVHGVRVGHTTLHLGDSIRTGVTAIVPGPGNLYQSKVPAAIYVGNGFGKLVGGTQVQELGNLETPIVLTNTLSVPVAIEALIDYTLGQPGNERVVSVNALVGETNDGILNDIRGRHVRKDHVLTSLGGASQDCAEGCVGAGTGTVCFGFKGGIGTASRVLPAALGGYVVGALVQSNFGGVLHIDGVSVGRDLGQFAFNDVLRSNVDGSCMIVVATDAPLDSRNLLRLAKRAFMGLARTGGIASNGSGDYAIAFSAAEALRIPHKPESAVREVGLLQNDFASPLFMAAIEATEEAIINSLFTAVTTVGSNRSRIEALPIDQLLPLLETTGRFS
jgi:D-aminopeptidase